MRLSNFQVKAAPFGRFKLGDLPYGWTSASAEPPPLDPDQALEVAKAQHLIDHRMAIVMILDCVADTHPDTAMGRVAAKILADMPGT